MNLKRIVLISITFLLLPSMSYGATVTFSDHYLRSWNTILTWPREGSLYGSSTTGSSGTIIETNSRSYADVYASSSYLNLSGYAEVDSLNIGSLGYEYTVAEATMRHEATMNIISESGFVDVSFDILFNKQESAGDGTYIHGEQRLRIFEDGNLIVAYLHGLSSLSSVQDIRLSANKSYEVHLSSTVYAKADAGFYAFNSRDFSASVSSVSEVPIPAALYLFSSSILGLLAIRSS